MNVNILKKVKNPISDLVRRSQEPSADEDDLGSKKQNISMFGKVINFFLLATVFLTPLLFLPVSSEVREFNKQSWLFLAVVVMLAVWVIKVLSTRKLSWVKTSLDYVVLAFLAIYFVSSLFSMDKTSSFLGYYGRFTGSFLSVLAMVLFYFLVVNNVRGERLTKKVLNYLMTSCGIIIAYSFLQLLGLYILPFSFAQSQSFNPIGSLVSLSIFSAVTILLSLWMWMNQGLTKAKRGLVAATLIISLLVMFLVNAFIGWLVLGIGLIAFLALGMVLDPKQSSNWFWKPMLVLVVSILFVGFQFLPQSISPRNLVNLNLPIEVQLSNSTTLSLVKNSLSSGAKEAVLGSGPGTTGLAFGGIKPESLNKTVVWSLNFDRASNEISNVAIETGILGLLAFEATSVLFLIYGLYFLFRHQEHPGRKLAFAFFMLWFTLFVAHFMYFFNTTFYFVYWLSIAAFMAVTHWETPESETKTLSFSSSPRSALSSMFASLLTLAVILVFAFFQTAVFVAEASYTSGLRMLNQKEPNFEAVAGRFARAVQLNQYRDVYYLALGQGLIFLSSQEAAKKEPDIAKIQNWLASSIQAGLGATSISPEKAANWSSLAQFYNNIKPLGAVGTDQAIINSWNEAIKRDSKNPSLYIRLAQAYSNASEVIDPKIAGSGADTDQDGLSDSMESQMGSDPKSSDSNSNGVSDGDEVKSGFNPAGAGRLSSAQLSQFTKIDPNMIKEAEKALNKAIELKADLPDSYIALARIMEKSGKIADAKKKMDEAVGKFPGNAEVRFEQGRIAYNQKNYNEAEKIFLTVIQLMPNHANAQYSLGLVYQQKGDSAKALAQFKKTREISGPNLDLEKLIKSLEEPAAAEPSASKKK